MQISNFTERIRQRTARIGIIGLGYVGLPLAIAFSQVGFKVLGFDKLEERVKNINKGVSYLRDIKDDQISLLVQKQLFRATTDQKRLSEMDIICICVPTPLNKTKNPDLSHVIEKAEVIADYLRREQLIILESTTYPGTTKEVILPILEKSNLKAGIDFFLAYSPERVDPGNTKYNLHNTPKVVSGIDAQSTELAKAIYSCITNRVIPVSCPEVAEMTKVFENVFRNVNIALVNELAQLCERMGISVWEVIDTAATKPFGYMAFLPGPGLGGHCIPLDPYYLANKAMEHDFHTRFIELAAQVNEQMPYYVVSRVMEALNQQEKSLKNANILVLGVTYKRDVADTRESPALKVIELLLAKGAQVHYHDHLAPTVSINHDKDSIYSVPLSDSILSKADCVVITTDHSAFDYNHIINVSSLIFDTKGVTRGKPGTNVVRL